jgi:hypothetical protein
VAGLPCGTAAARKSLSCLPILLLQRTDRFAWVEPDSGGYIEVFEHVQPPITAFILRDIGRWLPKPLSQGRLRQPGSLTLLGQQRRSLWVALGMNGFWQGGSRRFASA